MNISKDHLQTIASAPLNVVENTHSEVMSIKEAKMDVKIRN